MGDPAVPNTNAIKAVQKSLEVGVQLSARCIFVLTCPSVYGHTEYIRYDCRTRGPDRHFPQSC